MQVLETARLVLRWVTTDDAPFILELLNEPSFLQFIGDKGVRNLEDARNYILTGPVASYQRFGFGLYLVLLKAERYADRHVRAAEARQPARRGRGLCAPARLLVKGYAFEAASAVLAHGREAFGLRRIVAITSPDNAGRGHCWKSSACDTKGRSACRPARTRTCSPSRREDAMTRP